MITIENDIVRVAERDGTTREFSIGTPEAFALLSKLWLRAGWDTRYVYSFTWMGRPVIQLPEDMLRIQEVIYEIKPDIIIETGVAHGGSLVFYAGLCKAMGKGRVVGIDIEIRPQNRVAIERHELSSYLTLIEGNSVAEDVVESVRVQVGADETTFVVLDSNHSRDHVRAELESYGPMVSRGSYIVATDGIMSWLGRSALRTQPDWDWNNPLVAARDFVATHPEFIIAEPQFRFNEGMITERVTYWPDAFIKRIA